MNKQKLIHNLDKVRREFTITAEKIYRVKGNVIIGGWNLQDLVAHLSGWAIYQKGVLEQMQKGKLPVRIEDVGSFNKNSVEKRKSWNWNKVLVELKETTEELIKEYQNLPDDFWQKPIWQDKKITPKDFIKIEIKHYCETHLPQLQKI